MHVLHKNVNQMLLISLSVMVNWHIAHLAPQQTAFHPKYTVSQKNIPDVFSYNSRKHCRTFIIFGRNISKKASNQQMLYLSTSPN